MGRHARYAEAVIAALAGGAPTLGEAVRQAQEALLASSVGNEDTVATFALLGDPSAKSPLLP